jgi:replicative DNA helicase
MDAHPSNGRRRFSREPERPALGPLFDRQPPQSIEAEMSLLGSVILDPGVIPDVLSLIKGPDDFYKESHAHIYRAVLDIYDTRNTGDLVQIVDLLRDRSVLDQVGGANYLIQLAESVPAAVNAPHFARIVAEKAKLRRLIDAAGQILYDAYHAGELGPEGAREVLDKAEMSVFEIAQESTTADPQSLADLLQIEMDRIEAAERDGWSLSGVRSGFADLDELLRGFQPGELIILAARPSMGKTALSLNLAEQIAMGGAPFGGSAHARPVPVGFFSLEMSKNAIVQRLLSARSGVSSQHLRGGSPISKSELMQLGTAADELKESPIFIDDMPSMTVLNLRARARRMVAQHGVKVIMIDYLQLMTAPGAARESRQVEVSTISRGVKALARELNIPVICLAQLNRASEQREGNRPRMADLRESGSIEQDADVILLLHREDYYHVQDEDWKMENPDKVGVAEIIVAKQRNGPTDIVKLKWDPKTTRFKNLDLHAQPPGGYGFDDYSSPSQAAAKFPGKGAPAPEAKPWTQTFTPPPFDPDPAPAAAPAPRPASAFGARPKTGPAENHRDGGGSDLRPEVDEDEGL